MQIIDKKDRIVLFLQEENDLDIAIEKINKNDFNDDPVELYFGKYSVTFYDEKNNISIYFFENETKNPDEYDRLNLKESVFKDFEWNNSSIYKEINSIFTAKNNFKNVLIDLLKVSKLECFG
jgi:hypothetical protein